MLWVTGTNDFAYPMDSLQKSYRLAQGPHTLCIRPRMPHGHGGAGENPAEILAFAESQLKGGPPLAKITRQGRSGDQVWITFEAAAPIQRAELNYTCQTGRWQTRTWEMAAAQVDTAAHKATVRLPQGVKVYYLNLIDQRNCVVSGGAQFGTIRGRFKNGDRHLAIGHFSRRRVHRLGASPHF